MAVQGLPIEDESEMPAWCEEYLTPAQVENMLPRTRWAVLLDSAPLPPVAHHVALRLHLYAVGSTDATAYPSVDKLAAVTGWTRNTIRVALRQLEEQGWVRAMGRHYPSGKRASTLYTLTWPSVDVMMLPATVRCLAPRTGGLPCQRGAGWGTLHPGAGRCSLHDEESVGGQEMTGRGSADDPLRGSGDDRLGGQEMTPSGESSEELVSKHPVLTGVSAAVDNFNDNHGTDRDDLVDREGELHLGDRVDKLITLLEAVGPEYWAKARDGWRRARFEEGWTRKDIDDAETIAALRTKASA